MTPGSIVKCREREWVLLRSDQENRLLLRPHTGATEEIVAVHKGLLELACTADDMQPLADTLLAQERENVNQREREKGAISWSHVLTFSSSGHPQPFRWDEARRALLRAELDAWFARAYGLTRDELRYILDPADVYVPDFPGETFRVFKEKEIAKYGEYRTRRLVLEAWDKLPPREP